MTIETITTPGVPAHLMAPPAPAPSRIVAWVDSLSVALKASETIVDTPLCPDAWWPLPPNLTLKGVPGRNPRVPLPNEDRESYLARRTVAVSTGAVVLSAAESLGLDTMAAAITGVYVVGGKPALYAEAMLALLHTRGWRSRTVESSETRGAVAICRSDEAPEDARTYSFTMEQAERAGYVKGKGPNTGQDAWKGNEQYNLRPEIMLWSRAVTQGCRMEAPEVLKGMTSVEQRTDELAAERVDVSVVQPVTAIEITAGRESAEDVAAEMRTAAAGMRGAPSGLLAGAMRREAEASVALDHDPDGGTHSLPEADPASGVQSFPDEPQASTGPNPAPAGGITEGQKRKLGEVFAILDVTGTGQRLRRAAIGGRILGRHCGSILDLSEAEADEVLAHLSEVAQMKPSERAAAVAQLEGRGQGAPPAEPDAQNEADNLRAAAQAEQDLEPPADDPWRNWRNG